ncbi:hypothetical protein E3J74_09400 [Candidatus Bathyarchaeota archaeon]|nr:MAG: hypothetical protein E3J74_09400 [Candidatus Bathyarchaeota archaeon]
MINRQPKISVLFEVKAYKISKIVDFLVDTGARYSAITEKEATIMGIDSSLLPYSKREAVGFGGLFRNKLINKRVTLTFKSNKDEYKIPCSSFTIVCIPPNTTSEDREKMLRYTPNVLGMDILSKFKTCVDKNQVELTL